MSGKSIETIGDVAELDFEARIRELSILLEGMEDTLHWLPDHQVAIDTPSVVRSLASRLAFSDLTPGEEKPVFTFQIVSEGKIQSSTSVAEYREWLGQQLVGGLSRIAEIAFVRSCEDRSQNTESEKNFVIFYEHYVPLVVKNLVKSSWALQNAEAAANRSIFDFWKTYMSPDRSDCWCGRESLVGRLSDHAQKRADDPLCFVFTEESCKRVESNTDKLTEENRVFLRSLSMFAWKRKSSLLNSLSRDFSSDFEQQFGIAIVAAAERWDRHRIEADNNIQWYRRKAKAFVFTTRSISTLAARKNTVTLATKDWLKNLENTAWRSKQDLKKTFRKKGGGQVTKAIWQSIQDSIEVWEFAKVDGKMACWYTSTNDAEIIDAVVHDRMPQAEALAGFLLDNFGNEGLVEKNGEDDIGEVPIANLSEQEKEDLANRQAVYSKREQKELSQKLRSILQAALDSGFFEEHHWKDCHFQEWRMSSVITVTEQARIIDFCFGLDATQIGKQIKPENPNSGKATASREINAGFRKLHCCISTVIGTPIHNAAKSCCEEHVRLNKYCSRSLPKLAIGMKLTEQFCDGNRTAALYYLEHRQFADIGKKLFADVPAGGRMRLEKTKRELTDHWTKQKVWLKKELDK